MDAVTPDGVVWLWKRLLRCAEVPHVGSLVRAVCASTLKQTSKTAAITRVYYSSQLAE